MLTVPATGQTLRFYNAKGSELGRLELRDKELKFVGDADEAAKVFFEHVVKLYMLSRNPDTN